MSGLYNIERWAGDYRDDNLYYNCPCLYIPNESDEGRLKLLRQLDIIMAIGHEDSNIGNNRWLSGALWGKGIGNALREWDGWAHVGRLVEDDTAVYRWARLIITFGRGR